MGIAPEETGFFKRHPVAATLLVLLLIIAIGAGLKFFQMKYFPKPSPQEFITPILINDSFEQVDQYFNVKSTIAEKEQDALFSKKYKYNIVNWTCRPIGCVKVVTEPTLKLVCRPDGFTEDVRIAMKEDCSGVVDKSEVTVIFQLMSKTFGEYYLGRSGRIVQT